MKKILAVAASLVIAASAFAQDFQTGYFLQGYTHAYRLNPAFRPAKNFVSLPGLGEIYAGSRSNIGLNDILFPLDNGQLGTFMHPDVTSAQALGGLKDINKLSVNSSINLLSFGFKSTHGFFYHTVDINYRTLSSGKVSYNLFKFMKDGIPSGGSIDIPGTTLDSRSFVEVAYGINFKLGGIISVGARAKYLAGLMGANLNINNINVRETNGKWMVSGSADLRVAYKDLAVETKAGANGTDVIIDGFDNDGSLINGVSGNGVAIDLGVAVKILPNLNLSASITDLGGISWKNNIRGQSLNTSWEYNGDSDDIEDDLADLLELAIAPSDKKFEMLPATFRVGAEYDLLPFISLGVLGTQRTGDFSWTEVRGCANFRLWKILALTATVATGNFGVTYGGAANLNLGFLDLYLGMDAIPTKYTPQLVPVEKANIGLCAGLNITF